MRKTDDMPEKEDWLEPRELVGPALALTALAATDDAGFLAALGARHEAEEVLAHLSYAPPTEITETRALIESILAQPGRVPYAIRLLASGEFVGTTSFYEVAPTERALAIGHTWIARRHWRTGVNTEAKLLLLGRAFDQLGAERVVWHTDIRNERSQAAIARLGATREGVLRHHRIRRDGSWRDTVQFSMLRSEWPAARARLRGAAAAPTQGATEPASATDPALALAIVQDEARSRYEARVGNELVGLVSYRLVGQTVVIHHTETKPRWRGRSVAAQLTRFVLDEVRAKGQRVTPLCPYTSAFLDEHPSYRDLLA